MYLFSFIYLFIHTTEFLVLFFLLNVIFKCYLLFQYDRPVSWMKCCCWKDAASQNIHTTTHYWL